VPSRIILIGASTGGPGQIEKIIKALPKLNDTTLIIGQHMTDGFMPSFAKRLMEGTCHEITVVENGEMLKEEHIYLCCGHTTIHKNGTHLYFSQEISALHDFNPDINILFNSFVPFTNEIQILSLILTGIGEDGVNGCKNLSLKGCVCITEDESSAIVDGMPSRARNEVPNIKICNLDEIIHILEEFCK